jgi:hypothetical protein
MADTPLQPQTPLNTGAAPNLQENKEQEEKDAREARVRLETQRNEALANAATQMQQQMTALSNMLRDPLTAAAATTVMEQMQRGLTQMAADAPQSSRPSSSTLPASTLNTQQQQQPTTMQPSQQQGQTHQPSAFTQQQAQYASLFPLSTGIAGTAQYYPLSQAEVPSYTMEQQYSMQLAAAQAAAAQSMLYPFSAEEQFRLQCATTPTFGPYASPSFPPQLQPQSFTLPMQQYGLPIPPLPFTPSFAPQQQSFLPLLQSSTEERRQPAVPLSSSIFPSQPPPSQPPSSGPPPAQSSAPLPPLAAPSDAMSLATLNAVIAVERISLNNTAAMKAPKLKEGNFRQWKPLFVGWMNQYDKAWQTAVIQDLKYVRLMRTKAEAAAMNRGVAPEGPFYALQGGDSAEAKANRELELIRLNFVFFAVQNAVQEVPQAAEIVLSVQAPNVREAWRLLLAHFEPVTIIERQLAQTELTTMKQKQGETMREYTVRFMAKVNNLARMNGTLPDFQMCTIFTNSLVGLPPSRRDTLVSTPTLQQRMLLVQQWEDADRLIPSKKQKDEGGNCKR